MFCPKCRDEYRAGFTRCATCQVDLVAELKAEAAAGPARLRGAPERVSLVEYCGFLALDEAQDARARLRALGIRSELVVRDATDASDGEEYWLHVDRDRLAEVTRELGYDAVEPTESDGAFHCGECDATVPEDATSCPGCGARFEDGA
jgi:hypothetical protein